MFPITVRVGDIVTVEGRDHSVRNTFSLHSGGKLLLFTDGTCFALIRAEPLSACRLHPTSAACPRPAGVLWLTIGAFRCLHLVPSRFRLVRLMVGRALLGTSPAVAHGK